MPGLIDGTRYWVRKVDDNTIELYDTEANAIAATTITQGRKDLTGVRETILMVLSYTVDNW